MRSGDQRLRHGPAHLLLLGALLATDHLRRHLGQRRHRVIPGLPGLLAQATPETHHSTRGRSLPLPLVFRLHDLDHACPL